MDAKHYGSLLSKMTGQQDEGEIKLTSNQVDAVVELMLPRIATGMPGMPSGMECRVERTGEKSWTLHISKP